MRHPAGKCKSGGRYEAAKRLPAPSGARAERESQGPEARRRLRQNKPEAAKRLPAPSGAARSESFETRSVSKDGSGAEAKGRRPAGD
ncbi:conserved hypothetical protein [uncultured Pleomorphomonas sp.]|uniref:Uncharacterized protein n=1 Tax=uncultured Pleomorphomonas sp. TaxID=442121 RepID=A0A212LM32_9HYPH|nr:conserved hypothetical protein [uncultured Pleomorphomonas sp.]